MCYNCGCDLPDDPMGKGYVSEGGGSLTQKDIKVMAEKWDMSVEEAKKNMYKLLKKQLNK